MCSRHVLEYVRVCTIIFFMIDYKEDSSILLSSYIKDECSQNADSFYFINKENLTDDFNNMIQNVSDCFQTDFFENLDIDISNQQKIISILDSLYNCISSGNDLLNEIDFQNSPIFDFVGILLEKVLNLSIDCMISLYKLVYSIILFKKDRLEIYLPQIISMFSVSELDFRVLNLLIYIVTKIYSNQKEFDKYFPDLAMYIHTECTMFFFSILSSSPTNDSTNLLIIEYFAFFLYFEHDNKKLLNEFDDTFFNILIENSMSKLSSGDLFTTKISIDLLYQLSRFPHCIQNIIDNGIIPAICDFLLNDENQIDIDGDDNDEEPNIPNKNKKYIHQTFANIISNITNYETIAKPTENPSIFLCDSFPQILFNELNSNDPITKSYFIDFITSTLPQQWNYYLSNGIINFIIEQLPFSSFSEKRYMLRAFIIFLSLAPSSVILNYLNEDLIHEFEFFLDPEFWSSSEELCQTLLEILTPELLQIIRDSTFPNTLEDFIDKSPVTDSAEELMSHITGEYEEEEDDES